MKTEGKCKLCRQTGALVDSHVVPKALYDDIRIPEDELKVYVSSQPHSKRSRTGVYGQFLCKDCEDSFAPYDQYGVEFVRNYKSGRNGLPLWGSFSSGFIARVDYAKFKLWVLSILWRASACDHEYYGAFTLDRKRDQRLADSIKRHLPGAPGRFAIVVMLLDEDPEWLRSVLSPTLASSWGESESGTLESRDVCLLYLPSGFKIFIYIDERGPLPVWQQFILREDGQLRVARSRFSSDEKSRLKRLLQLGPPD